MRGGGAITHYQFGVCNSPLPRPSPQRGEGVKVAALRRPNLDTMATEIISGINPIYEVLRAGRRKVKHIWIAHKDTKGLMGEILKMAARKGVSVKNTSREEIFNRSRLEKNQGIIAEVEAFRYSTLEEILKNGEADPTGHFILVLDSILDPQNLGSIIRTAHLAGVHGIIVQERNSAPIGPAATRASAGAIEYIPIAQVVNISRTLKLLKKHSIWVVGADISGENVYSHVFSGSYAIVMGSEGKGLRRLIREECDILLSIPMNPINPGVDSYNVSVAAGILLSEVNRQRRYKD